ncbi:NADP-dependent oxidoreductase [Micromonospora sp. NPDC000316]|uniref:NADP-dependent oxidoreductase n=1 Tax=Micromonospora sp. NPDC000316 TaxID=3364216 RepID=UPI0036CC9F3A
MKAIQFSDFGPADVLRLVEVEAPHAGPGEIRISVRASGVSPSDTYVRSGLLGGQVTLPHIPGYDAAGVVDEIGDGVTGVSLGDEVFGTTAMTKLGGANAEHVVLVAWATKPAAWSWAEAGGAAGNVETATRVLDRLDVGAGQTLLVHGAAGGVGTIAVQLAAARGATVIGTASEHNHEFLRSLGATPTTYGAGMVERVTALAPGGVDVVFDCAGGALPDLIEITGDRARVVTIADFGAAAHGVHMSHTAPGSEASEMVGSPADPMALHGLGIAATLADEGRLRVPVAASFPLSDAPAAHLLSESRRARGKIVMLPQPVAH